MPEYKIRKGGKEFTAKKLSTLLELAQRGLLRSGTPISVDGGEFGPASEVAALADALTDDAGSSSSGSDLFQHFADASADEADGADGLLADFLDQVGSGAPARVATSPGAAPTKPAPSHIGRLEKSPGLVPGGLSGVMTSRGVRPTPASDDKLPMVEPEALDALDDEADTLPYEGIQADSGPASLAKMPALQPGSTIPDLEDSAPKLTPADVPVSFAQWMEKRDSDTSLLEGFGRYDDGIVVSKALAVGAVNWWRVGVIVLLAGTAIFFRYMWVSTIAETQYPLESEIIAARQPPPETGTIDTPTPSTSPELPLAQQERRAHEIRLRADLKAGRITEFNTAEELQDVLFFELVNRGVNPISVTVDSKRVAGTQDKSHRRPTRAKLSLSLRGVQGDEDVQLEELEARLITTWLLLGKYQAEARIHLDEVAITVGSPSPWSNLFTGRELAAYWDQQLIAEDLFLKEK
ncbi:MAG: hypothetical protein GY898_08910 [Proteobacteria bacterium]|nr:hypothetical protein [Pseudomonadota bacterium]